MITGKQPPGSFPSGVEGQSEIVLYTTEDGQVKIDTVFQHETIWLTQKKMAELFAVQRPAITKHLKNVFESGELDEEVVSSILEHTTQHGAIEGKIQKKQVKFYNLDAIIAVGYRVNSKRATQFRIWATNILKEYIIKGFAMDDERLKQADKWGYFDEWLERIRDIRASEKRFYQKIRDIYATAVDYDKTSEQAQLFFKKVQNKMLWAISGKTAAELIENRSNSGAPNMGLTSWRGSIKETYNDLVDLMVHNLPQVTASTKYRNMKLNLYYMLSLINQKSQNS